MFKIIIKILNKIKYTIKIKKNFSGSTKYWEDRYKTRGTSGRGSYGKYAEFKAEIINSFIKENNINSVIDFGCGDGNQLSLMKITNYVGLDVSSDVIKICIDRFKKDKTKRFFLYNPKYFSNKSILKGELTLSLDVIYHLIENEVFEKYMKLLFYSSKKFVIIYSTNTSDIKNSAPHVKHRKFTKWVSNNLKNWELNKEIENKYPNKSSANFFIFEKKQM